MDDGAVIRTKRLDLLPATPRTLKAELEGNAAFENAIGARVPDNWPPELYDEQAINWTINALENNPEMHGWSTNYVVERGDTRVVAGIAGYKGPPGDDGTVEIGYGLLDQFRGKGYATEASRALIERAFNDSHVQRVIAQTYPHLTASINVMQRCGMTYGGEVEEPGVIYFELRREDYERIWANDDS